jgi:hypothetical protein
MSPTAEGPVLLRRGVGLHHENFFDDGLDARCLSAEVPFCVACGHAEYARQE